jgi:hypothetical protein
MIGKRNNFVLSKVAEWLCVVTPLLIGLLIILYLRPEDRVVLLSAVRHGRLEDVQRLIVEKKVSVDSRNNSGNTPLMLAAAGGYFDIVEFLVHHGANLNATNGDGRTALMLAAVGNQTRVVRYLSRNGADANIRDKTGLTVFDIAKTNVDVAGSLPK